MICFKSETSYLAGKMVVQLRLSNDESNENGKETKKQVLII